MSASNVNSDSGRNDRDGSRIHGIYKTIGIIHGPRPEAREAFLQGFGFPDALERPAPHFFNKFVDPF